MEVLEQHGCYSLETTTGADDTMIVRRQDSDHKRTVCFVWSRAEWSRFTSALDAGEVETRAVILIGPRPVTLAEEIEDDPLEDPCAHCGGLAHYVVSNEPLCLACSERVA